MRLLRGVRLLKNRPRQKLAAYVRHCFANYVQAIKFSKACQRALPAERVSICLAHDVFALQAASDIQQSKGAYFIADVVEISSVRQRSGQYFRTTPALGAWVQNRQHLRALGRADEIITVSPSLAAYVTASLGRQPKLIRNCQPDTALGPHRGLRILLKIPKNAKIACLVNTLAPGYGVETAISALESLGDNVHLVCIGSFVNAKYQAVIHKVIADANLDHKVHFLKPRQHLEYIELISEADVGLLLLDTRIENMRRSLPNRFFDFVSAGLPIISTNIEDVVTYVDRFNIGMCLRQSNGPILARCIAQCIDQQNNQTMRENVSTARAAFTWEREAIVFRQILACRAPNQGRLCILANKDISQNMRVAKMAKTAFELGFDVSVMSRTAPSQLLRTYVPGCQFINVKL